MGNQCSVDEFVLPYARKARETETEAYFLPTYSASVCKANDFMSPREVFKKSCQNYGDLNFLGTRTKNEDGTPGPFTWRTYSDVFSLVEQLGAGIEHLELSPLVVHDDESFQKEFRFAGICSRNRPEYMVFMQACQRQGVTMVPLYDTLGPDVMEYVINQTQLSTVFVEEKKLKDSLTLLPRCPTLKTIVTLEETYDLEFKKQVEAAGGRLFTFTEILAEGRCHPTPEKEYDPLTTVNTICYTSGTTGTPKGAMITHGNMMAMNAALQDVFKSNEIVFTPEDVHLSYLPYAHVLERAVTEAFLAGGSQIGYYRGQAVDIVPDVQELRPTIFISVPRLLNRVYDKIMDNGSKLSGLKKYLFDSAFSTKLARIQSSGQTTHALYDRLVMSKTRDALGGRVRILFSGSAPMSANVIDFLKAAFCCPFLEGYGLTETFCAGGITHFRDTQSGHVGGLLGCNEMKIVSVPEMGYSVKDANEEGISCPRGEVCFRGDSIFKGYFRAPEKTKEVIDEEGFFHTGDVAEITESGAIRIIDRAKNIFKLSQGEYVAPEKIENIYGQAPAVGQAFVFGYSTERFLVGVVVPAWEEFVKDWAKENGKNFDDKEALCQDEDLKNLILEQCVAVGKSQKLFGFEQIQAVHLTPEAFTVENDLLTPSFKLKRHIAKDIFKNEIDQMYEQKNKE